MAKEAPVGYPAVAGRGKGLPRNAVGSEENPCGVRGGGRWLRRAEPREEQSREVRAKAFANVHRYPVSQVPSTSTRLVAGEWMVDHVADAPNEVVRADLGDGLFARCRQRSL